MLRTTLWLLGVLLLLAGAARAEEFVVRPGGANKVVFLSKAPVESSRARHEAGGAHRRRPGGRRRQHHRPRRSRFSPASTRGIASATSTCAENHLETAKYRRRSSTGHRGRAGGRAAGSRPAGGVRGRGTFALHGVSRRLRTHGRGDAPRIRAGSASSASRPRSRCRWRVRDQPPPVPLPQAGRRAGGPGDGVATAE